MGNDHVPKRGEVAPDIELLDSTGARLPISALVAKSPRVFVFYRGCW